MHPLVLFRYCPRCGSSRFEEHNEKAKKCRDCGFVYYFNSCSATVALILNSRNELLVTRRAKEPAKGTFDLPGGFIDMYETGKRVWPGKLKKRRDLRSGKAPISFHYRIFIRSAASKCTRSICFSCAV